MLYRSLAEQVNGEAQDRALAGYLRCSIHSGEEPLFERALETWSIAQGSLFGDAYALAEALEASGKGAWARRLIDAECRRQKSWASLLWGTLATHGLRARSAEAQARVLGFREAEKLASLPQEAQAARVWRIRASADVPSLRSQALKDAEHEAKTSSKPSATEARLLAETLLYSGSRFKRASALQTLAELAARDATAEASLKAYVASAAESLTPLEEDRLVAFARTRGNDTIFAGPPPPALAERAASVLSGAYPLETPRTEDISGRFLEFVAECMISNDASSVHFEALRARLERRSHAPVAFGFRCLVHVWERKPSKAVLDRTTSVGRELLMHPGAPDHGFLDLLRIAPDELKLDIAHAGHARGEEGALDAMAAHASEEATNLAENVSPEAALLLLEETKRLGCIS